MGIFQAKPSMVEAEQLSANPSTEQIQKILKWLDVERAHADPIGVNFTGPGRFIAALYGDWIVKTGDDQFEVLDKDTFNARYSWIGPKEYYDAPYMVN